MDTRPRIAYPRAIAAILIPIPVAAAVVYFGTHILNDYGWSLFVGLPFVLPMVSVVIYGAGREVTQGQYLQIGLLWLLVALVLMVGTAFEGLICILPSGRKHLVPLRSLAGLVLETVVGPDHPSHSRSHTHAHQDAHGIATALTRPVSRRDDRWA